MKNKEEFKEAFQDSLPVMAGYIVLGTGFGISLADSGHGMLYSFLMSVFIYAGSMQYVAISLITSSASLLSAAMMSLVVNIRHLCYGISMLEEYSKIKKGKIYDIFALTDETFSIVVHKKLNHLDKDRYYFYLSILAQSYWVLGSLFGSILSNILPFSSKGVEFSMTALFICVFLNQWQDHEHVSSLGGLLISFLCLLVFGASNFVIPSIVLIVVFLMVISK